MFENSIFDIFQGETGGIDFGLFLFALAASAVLGFVISFVYLKINKQKLSTSFVLTLIILPPIVTAIIYLIGTNIASAFSLAGAFAIIRFRSEPGDTKDIAYVLFTMAVGLACGMGYIFHAAIITVILCAIVIVIDLTKYGKVNTNNDANLNYKVLKITLSESMEFEGAFDDIFDEFTESHEITRIKTTELGSLYVVEFLIALKKDINIKEFIDKLRCRNGNLSISIFQRQTGIGM